jgi:DNA-binding MarR family transcriptional regulator
MEINSQKVQLLEIAMDEGAVTLDWGLDVYSSKSNVSRAIGDLVEKQFLIEKKPPEISKFRKAWTLTDKAEKYLEYEHTENKSGT